MSGTDDIDALPGFDPEVLESSLGAGIEGDLQSDLDDIDVQSDAVRARLETRSPSADAPDDVDYLDEGFTRVPGESDAPAVGAEPDLNLLVDSYVAEASLAGTVGADSLAGDSRDERIAAKGGDDTVDGGAGDDLILGDSLEGDAPVGYDSLVEAGGAVSFFKFEEGSGSSAGDSLLGNDGILRNGAHFTSDSAYAQSGGAVEFDGRNDYVEVPHDDAYLLDSGYVQFWFKPDDLGGTQSLFSKDSNGYDDGGHLNIDVKGNGAIEVRFQSDDRSYYVESASGAADDGEWTHLVFGWGEGGMKLYVDGQLVDSDSYTGGMGTTSGGAGNHEPIVIGASSRSSDNGRATPTSQHFEGRIDGVAIHGGSISDAAAAAYFAAADGVADVAGDDLLFGADGDDVVLGGAGADSLFGGAGDDVLAGGAGDDFLVGDALDGDSPGGGGTGSVETNVIDVALGGTSYQPEDGNPGGDPYYVIRADGEVIAEGYVTWAQSGPFDASDPASWQTVSVNWPNDGSKPGEISVQFTNDAYGGTASTDRNLYVERITVNGSSYDVGWNLNSAGTQTQDTGDANDPVTIETATVTRTVVDSDFSDGAGDFAYQDDAFGTDESAYADGAVSDGALHIDLGGVDNDDVQNMSGGWTTQFSLDGDASGGTLTFSYRLDQDSEYEDDEVSAVLVSIDGELIGVDGNDYVAIESGGGDSGWQTVTIDLGALSAGQHSLTIGGFNSQKTTASESTRISIDNVTLNYAVTTAGEVVAGNDTLLGGEGDDTLLGNGGEDSLYGGAGADSLYGGDGDDALSGGDGDDLIEGNGGDDAIVGGLGDDLIYGDGGLDGGGRGAGAGFDSLAQGNGLVGEIYYDFRDTTVAKAWQRVESSEADATFTATELDYPQGGGSNEGTTGDWLGQDTGSLDGDPSVNFSYTAVHIEGWIYIPEGTHDFSIKSDDGFQLKIGGEELATFDGTRGFAETAVQGTYEEGLYAFDLVYFEHTGSAGLEIASSFTDGAPLDSSRFYQQLEDSGLTLTWVDTGDGTGYYAATGSGDQGESGASEPGNDVIEGGDGADTIYGNEEHDTLSGGAGDDVIYGDGLLGGGSGGGESGGGFPSALFPAYGHAISNVVLYLADSDGDITKVKIDSFDRCGDDFHDLDELPLAGFLATEYPELELVAATIKAGNNGDPDVARGEGELTIVDAGYQRGDLPLSSKSYETWDADDTLGSDSYDAADEAARAGDGGGDQGEQGGGFGRAGDDVISGGDGNDTIQGNEENDTLFGNDGDDLIYGDIASRGGAEQSGSGATEPEQIFASDFESGDDDFEHAPFEGWSSHDGKIEVRYGEGVDGSDAIELNEDPGNHFPDAGDVYRNVTTEAGATYTLDFQYAARPGYDATVARFQVLVDGEVVGTFSADGTGDGSPQYQAGSVSFTGTGGTQQISIVAAGVEVDEGRGAFLDDIVLTRTAADSGDAGGVGAPGRDILDGGEGNDTLVGNEDNDTLTGGSGDDTLIGDGALVGGNTVTGTIDASNFQDYVSGSNSTSGGPAAVAWVDSDFGTGFGVQPEQNDASPVQEETGFNPESYRSETLTVDFGRGIQTATVELEAFYVDNGGANPEVARWEAFRDGELVGAGIVQQTGGGTATLEVDLGGQLFDSLVFQGEAYGRDYYNQGVTDDSSDFLISKIDWTAPEGSEAAGFGGVAGTAGDDILTGGEGDDRLFGNEADDVLDGGAGDDLLSGGSGDDFLDGWYGDDTVIGGSGDDTIMWDSADSYIRGGSGHDTLVGYEGDDWIYLDDANFGMGEVANGGIEVVDLGNGDNFLIGDGINQGDTSLTVYGGDGTDWISTWGDGDDALYGGGGTLDQIWGGAGDDLIDGGAGVDYLYGGAGNDTLVGGAAYDVFYVGRGDGSTQIVDDAGPNDFFGETRDGNGLVLFWGYNDFATYEGVGSEDDVFQLGDTLTSASQVSVTYDDESQQVLVRILEARDTDNGGADVTFDYGTITALNLWDVAGGGTLGYEPWNGERDITRFEWDDENNRFIFQGLDLGQ